MLGSVIGCTIRGQEPFSLLKAFQHNAIAQHGCDCLSAVITESVVVDSDGSGRSEKMIQAR